VDLVTACRRDDLFAPWFKRPETWRSWFTFIRAAFALPPEEGDLELFTVCTGRATWPAEQAQEVWIASGRRSGKSFVLALIAVFLACFKDWRPLLSPGERAVVMVIGADRRQARVIMRYISALLHECPLIAPMIVKETKSDADGWGFSLDNRTVIEVHTANFRTVRGYTIVAALCDEVAFWRDEASANPDKEVVEGLRPGMATVPGSMLLAASSPYSRRGMLWETWRRHFGKEGPILVWQSETMTMNPTIASRVIEDALVRDASAAASEWFGLFRSDLESFVERESVEACIEPGVRERAPISGTRYAGFIDPSGGRQDAMTLAIAHKEADLIVLDCVRERTSPFNPTDVVAEFAATCKDYRVHSVQSDRYGGEWPVAAFRAHGISCKPAPKPRSDLYRELLPLINSRRVELLDIPRLISQFVSLERRVGRGGRDSIDHPPGAHDDLANAAAGVLVAGQARAGTISQGAWLGV
jgi:hypothetical protein